MPDVITLANRFRAQLIAQDARQLERLSNAYGLLYARLREKIDLLVYEIGALEKVTTGRVVRLARYKELLDDIERELTQFSGFLSVELSTDARLLIQQAGQHAGALVGSYGLTFSPLQTEAVETLLGFLAPGGALMTRIEALAGTNAQYVGEKILEAVGLGYNPRKLAAQINNALGGGLTDALRMARTTQIWTYREATRANYANNADVVLGWIWWAELDGACMSCVNQHGTIHKLNEALNDHHNGRCAMLPFVGDNPVEQSGADWFAEQSEEYQRRAMGPGKFDAWKAGKISIADMTKTISNDVFGDMKTETPLKELLEERQ